MACAELAAVVHVPENHAGRVEVDARRTESFEGAPARNHGPSDRRGVIVDDIRHCSGPNGSNKRHRTSQRAVHQNGPLTIAKDTRSKKKMERGRNYR